MGVPLAFSPGFHEPFVHARWLLLFALGLPAAALLPAKHTRGTLAWTVLFAGLALFGLLGEHTDAPGSAARWAAALRALAGLALCVSLGTRLAHLPHARTTALRALALSPIPVLLLGASRRLASWPSALPDRPDVGLAATVGNSNELAEFAAPLALLLAGLVSLRSLRLWALGGSLAALAATLWSDSRAGWLGLIAGSCALVFAWPAPGLRRRLLRVGLALALGATCLGGAALLSGRVADRLATLTDPQWPTNIVRLEVWTGTWEVFLAAPGTGTGPGGFERAFPPHRGAREWRLTGAASRVDSPHNEELRLLATGGLGGLLAVAGAAFLLLRGLRDLARTQAEFLPALGASLAVTAWLAQLRSPLEHPSGLLLPALLAGWLAGGGRRIGEGQVIVTARSLLALLVIAGGIGTLSLAREDRALERYLQVQRRLQNAQTAGKGEGVPGAALREFMKNGPSAQAALDELLSAGPGTPHRLYRAALDAYQQGRLRLGLEKAKLEEQAALFPEVGATKTLLERILRDAPWHQPARLLLARLELDLGQRAAAVFRLEEAVKALPAGPLARPRLAALLAEDGDGARARSLLETELALDPAAAATLEPLIGRLRLSEGREPATAGAWLLRLTTVETPPKAPRLEAAREALEHGDPVAARILALRHLAVTDSPGAPALALLSELGYGPLKNDEAALLDADLAAARTRLGFAVEALRAQDTRQARLHLRLAVRKDPSLFDARLLLARLAHDLGDATSRAETLTSLRERGLEDARLRALCERLELLRPLTPR